MRADDKFTSHSYASSILVTRSPQTTGSATNRETVGCPDRKDARTGQVRERRT